jgi:hypothetical protein
MKRMSMRVSENERNSTMNRMKRMTIGLLGAGLLLGVTAARAEEKAAGGDVLALPWTELREPWHPPIESWHPPKNDKDKEFKERYKRAYAELTKREGTPRRPASPGAGS